MTRSRDGDLFGTATNAAVPRFALLRPRPKATLQKPKAAVQPCPSQDCDVLRHGATWCDIQLHLLHGASHLNSLNHIGHLI